METTVSEGYRIECAAPGCGWQRFFESKERFLTYLLQWHEYHDHGGSFTMEARFPVNRTGPSLEVGDEFVFKTREGRRENGNKVVATAPNGKVALFDREVPLTSALEPEKHVRGVVKEILSNAVIVVPIEVLGDLQPLDDPMPCRLPKEG